MRTGLFYLSKPENSLPTYVDSTSTWDEVVAAYEDATSYDVANDADMCREFIVAARVLLRRLNTVVKNGTGHVEMDAAQVSGELEKAEAWLAANDTTSTTAARSTVRHVRIESYR